MAAIITLNVDLSKLDQSKVYEGKNGGKYYPLAVRIVDEYRYGKNVYATTDYTKDEKSAGAQEERIGNGKVRWTNGLVEVAIPDENEQQARPSQAQAPKDDFPF